ncbi:MAG: hypothetical protein LBN08_03020 [Lactobacillales bacterium]|jgi:hypothetical protein|nr:hypothetical protein [Lactobacillales bacterium]
MNELEKRGPMYLDEFMKTKEFREIMYSRIYRSVVLNEKTISLEDAIKSARKRIRVDEQFSA